MAFNDIYLGSFLLIVITGVVTTLTDLRSQKIQNNHLVAIAAVAVIFMFFKWVGDQAFPRIQLLSTVCAMAIAWLFFINDLWRGGDAKLFVLYAFLMCCVTGYEDKFFLPSIVLFINTFIFALTFILLDILKNFKWQSLVDYFHNFQPQRFAEPFLLVASSSWLLFPLFIASGLKHNAWSFILFYLITYAFRRRNKKLCHKASFHIFIFICGLILRCIFTPEFFALGSIAAYFKTLIIYFVLACATRELTVSIKGPQHRVPFAPFLFLGCILSYSPFLQWIMKLRHLMPSMWK